MRPRLARSPPLACAVLAAVMLLVGTTAWLPLKASAMLALGIGAAVSAHALGTSLGRRRAPRLVADAGGVACAACARYVHRSTLAWGFCWRCGARAREVPA